jgi:hypothetical protein
MAPPNPKRNTPTSQRVQNMKLSAPFRSPFRSDPSTASSNMFTSPSKVKVEPTDQEKRASPLKSSTSASGSQLSTPHKPHMISVTASKDFTPRAAAQFKSPFKCTTSKSGVAPSAHPTTRLTPAIQSLEAQVQLLRRAVKIREAEARGKGVPLDTLAKKWKDAGREVAREVWALVKDNVQIQDAQRQSAIGFQSGWGWEEDESAEHGYGQNKDYEEEQEKKQDNIGTMLRQLRIDPNTFGWNEALEDFVD